MSINGMQGKPRTGKSYETVVTHIIPTITVDKRKIVTNLPLNVDHFCKVYGDYCRDLIEIVDGDYHNYGGKRPFSEVEHYMRWVDWENDKGQKVYFYIDECHLALPKGKSDAALEEWYSMHGHYGFDIMLITQNFRKVSIDIRDMVDVCFRTIKKTALGQEKKYILKVHDGASQTTRSVVATHEREYEKRYFAFYKSHTMSNKSVDEATTKDINVWWKHWTIKASVAFFLFGFFILSKAFSSADSKNKIDKTDKNQQLESNEATGAEITGHNSKEPGANNKSELPINTEISKTYRQMEYEKMVERSKKFHPYYKVGLSISGYAEYMDDGRRTKQHYFSATQNGQHVFTLQSSDLMLAGYEIRVLTECSVKITFFDYVDYLTCDAPRQGAVIAGQQLASNNPQ